MNGTDMEVELDVSMSLSSCGTTILCPLAVLIIIDEPGPMLSKVLLFEMVSRCEEMGVVSRCEEMGVVSRHRLEVSDNLHMTALFLISKI